MKPTPPSNLEMQVLSVLWEQGPLPARAVLEAMPDKKKRAYTSILSVMQVMEKKGLLRHETEGNRHIYFPLVKKRDVLKPLLTSLLTNLFGGSPSTAMQHLLETSKVSREELSEMRNLLAQYEQNEKGEKTDKNRKEKP